MISPLGSRAHSTSALPSRKCALRQRRDRGEARVTMQKLPYGLCTARVTATRWRAHGKKSVHKEGSDAPSWSIRDTARVPDPGRSLLAAGSRRRPAIYHRAAGLASLMHAASVELEPTLKNPARCQARCMRPIWMSARNPKSNTERLFVCRQRRILYS